MSSNILHDLKKDAPPSVRRMQTLRQVFAEGDWLSAEQINALQPQPPRSKSQPASDWKRRDRIYGVSYGGREFFARYQFDAMYQPLPVMRDVLAAWGEVSDPWVLAAWFHYPNSWLTDEQGKTAGAQGCAGSSAGIAACRQGASEQLRGLGIL